MKIITTISRIFFSGFLVLMMLSPFSIPMKLFADPALLGDLQLAPEDCLPKYPGTPTVKIKVRVPACAEPGQGIEYRICVENCSTAEAHHVVVKNLLPSNARFVRADPMPTKLGTELQWQLGTIGGGATREIILLLQPTNQEDVKNCLRVQFEHGQCVVTRQSGASRQGEPFDPTQPPGPPGTKPKVIPVPGVTPEGVSLLELVVSGPTEQYVNLASKYEILVTNKGKVAATNLQVYCRLPKQLKAIKASEPGVTADDVTGAVWNLGNLEPGAHKLLEVTLRATEKGEFCFKTTAEAELNVKKEVEYCTKFIGVSAMSLEMYDSADPIFLGEKTSYPVIIRSVGSAALTNIRLKAFIPEALKLERANAAFKQKEPVKGGRWIEFEPLPRVEAGEQTRYEIFVEAVEAGVTRFHVEVMADQLDADRPVIEQELTRIVDDREGLKAKALSREK